MHVIVLIFGRPFDLQTKMARQDRSRSASLFQVVITPIVSPASRLEIASICSSVPPNVVSVDRYQGAAFTEVTV